MNSAFIYSISGVGYFADNQAVIPFNGELWNPCGLTNEPKVSIGEVDKTGLSLSIQDPDNLLTKTSRESGLTGRELYFAMVENIHGNEWSLSVELPEMELLIDECSGSAGVVAVDALAVIGWSRSGGPPVQTRNCVHEFRGVYCKYAGAIAFCQRTREYCLNIMDNLRNFGGHYFALEAGETIVIGTEYTLPGSVYGGQRTPFEFTPIVPETGPSDVLTGPQPRGVGGRRSGGSGGGGGSRRPGRRVS